MTIQFNITTLSIEDLSNATLDNPTIINEQDERGWTLLHYLVTISEDNRNKVEELISYLATLPNLDINLQDLEGNTALHLAISYLPNIDSMSPYCLFIYITLFNNIDFSLLNNQGLSVLHMLAKSGLTLSDESMQLYLQKAFSQINCLSEEKFTALYYAIKAQKTSMARQLLEAGCDTH